MTIRRPRLWPYRLQAALLAAFLAALRPGTVLSSPESAVPAASPEQPVTVSLELQETSNSIADLSASVATGSEPFKKEPAAAAGKTIRGHLNFGGDASNNIPFLWQRDAGKLFLDLNRNQDLTDDPAGEFSAHLQRPLSDQTFANVRLLFDTPTGKYPILANINFWTYGSRTSCRVELRSFWQGKLTLHGQDWQVGVIPGALGRAVFRGNQMASSENEQFLLRPWEQRNQDFSANGDSLAAIPFARKLFVGGHAYEANGTQDPQAGEIKPLLRFAEQPVTLGELKITGKYIRRLTLSGGPYLVILDQPPELVKIPVGTYNEPSVLLEQGGARASCQFRSWQPGRRVTVTDKTSTVLNAGGPLTNSVTATRRGRNLELNYRLVGAGDATYQLAKVDRSQPPGFVISKGGQQVASGKFAFG